MKKFESIAGISSIKSRVDGSWAVTFETNELTAQQLSDLGVMQKLAGKLIFATPDAVVKADISDVPVEKGDKTPSQRLRDRMYASYAGTHADTKDFNNWYYKQLDEIGLKYLERLN